tara:strand:- start:74 stop:1291 length:1218 start_codon:yes stop_codon:yes gene_type:complete
MGNNMSYIDNKKNRIVVKNASDFGTIDSTKEYFLDGIIDMGATSIEVPSGGIYISGYNFNLSGLTSTENNYTLFTSPVGGSGDVLFMDFHINVSGTTSQVYDIKSDTGFKAVEVARINYNNCTSLGEIDNYRQGLETGTGRFGGSPELTLTGAWVGGYFIDTSIVRSLTDGAYSLFKAGAGFSMASRFRSNMNIDIPSLASYLDFSPSNFTNPSILQLENGIISRDGAFNAADTNYTPNIQASDLASKWKGNNGLENTFEGGRLLVTSENLTTIAAGSTWYDLNAIWTANRLEHFDSPSAGQLRHVGNSPREYRLTLNFSIEGKANDELGIRLKKWDDSTSSFFDFTEIRRQINSLVGGRDVAIFNYVLNVNLDENDYVYFQVRNNSGTTNVTLEENSDWFLEER